MGSKRLRGKMMLKIAGEPLLKLIFDRLKRSEELGKIVLATSVKSENDALEKLAKEESIECFRGSEEDVLERFYQVTQREPDFGLVVRVCGDNPLIDPLEIDRLVKFHRRGQYDYSFNHIPYNDNGYPDGVGAEVLSRDLLAYIREKANRTHQREHCLDYIWDNVSEFRMGMVKAPDSIRRPDIKLDVDTEEDLAFLRGLLGHLNYDQVVQLDTEAIIKIYGKRQDSL